MVGIRSCTLYLSHVTATSNGLGPYTYALFRQDKIDVRFTTMTAMDSGILALNSALNSLSPIRCGGGEKKKIAGFGDELSTRPYIRCRFGGAKDIRSGHETNKSLASSDG